MDIEVLKEMIKEMVKNGELDLSEVYNRDVALSKNALIEYLEQEKKAHMNKSYRINGFYDSTNVRELKARDEGYTCACNILIERINRGEFNKEES